MPWKVTPLAYTSGQSESDRPKMYTVRCCIRTREVPKSPTFFSVLGKSDSLQEKFPFQLRCDSCDWFLYADWGENWGKGSAQNDASSTGRKITDFLRRKSTTRAIPVIILYGHFFMTCHPSAKILPNRSRYRGIEKIHETVFRYHYTVCQKPLLLGDKCKWHGKSKTEVKETVRSCLHSVWWLLTLPSKSTLTCIHAVSLQSLAE